MDRHIAPSIGFATTTRCNRAPRKLERRHVDCCPDGMANHTDIHDERYGAEAGRRDQAHRTQWVRGRGREATRPLLTPVDADDADALHADDAVSIDEVVERLSREMAAAVHRAAAGERDELHEYEMQLHQEEQTTTHPRSPAKRARITFFSIALWLAAAGVLLTFLLPSAGIVCMVMAGLAGILAAVLGPGDDTPDRFTQ
jgi:hypothetical protein